MEDKTIRRCRRWQVGDRGGSEENFQLSVKGMSVQADGYSWKGRAKHITSLLYSTKHVQSPDRPENHRLHTAYKKREMPRIKMTLLFHLLIIMFVFFPTFYYLQLSVIFIIIIFTILLQFNSFVYLLLVVEVVAVVSSSSGVVIIISVVGGERRTRNG